MSSVFIHVVPGVRILFLFELIIVPICMYHIVFIPPSRKEHGCLRHLAIVNRAVMNISVESQHYIRNSLRAMEDFVLESRSGA